MKRLLFLFLSFFIFPAFAVTSESYVDAAVNTLQNEIPAVDANTVLINTGVAGEIGTKKIYDSTQDFATQTDALITAETFNTAVQNAIDNEYVCVEWMGEHVPGNCLLWQIRPVTPQQTPPILPTGYTQLEYIESTGTQWIDTGYYPNNLTNFEIRYNLVVVNMSYEANFPYGTTTVPAVYSAMYGLFRTVAGRKSFNRMAWGNQQYGTNVTLGNTGGHCGIWYTDKYLQNKMYINDELVATAPATSLTEWYAPNSLLLFARNADSNANFMPAMVKISYAKAWEGKNMVFNMVPARRNSDGELGMYDTVSGTFFINAGTGEFIAGPDVISNLYLPSAG